MATKEDVNEMVGIGLAFALWSVYVGILGGGWLQHVYTCISMDSWGLLIAGGVCFPVGIIHGIGIWIGVWPSH